MTGNQIKGKGFRGALRYNLEKVEKGVAEILGHTFVRVNEQSIMKEIQIVKVLRPNLQKFFYHTSINFPPHEVVSNETMKRIALDYLASLGFDQHQYIIFRHHDANHPHLHILVNRIGYDGKVLSDSNDYARSEKVLRYLEKKYNLTEVASSKKAVRRAPTKDELEMMKRTNAPSHKLKMQQNIREVLQAKNHQTLSEFIEGLEKRGVKTKFNIAKTGYISGISYSTNGFTITGSKLGAEFKWTKLKEKIDYNAERDLISVLRINTQGAQSSSQAITGREYSKSEKKSAFDTSTSAAPHQSFFQINDDAGLDPAATLKLKSKRRRWKRIQ
ncbi:relaxase/mobilization nuclease domain-containing protein [Pseudochryseolinea flava]|uniref:Relaxase/mobilization nuclease n=1 Tax=Pseudochryseolinea flava TaxID=2059302 RepID=A0A364XZ90_9BACT|nr:relaxase/mobilization nuclease domain-containing protein [Pseudochryseolinea flava]RAV99666.1 relaxase/mobilization nuclease [Pseudochryseolinea flava]